MNKLKFLFSFVALIFIGSTLHAQQWALDIEGTAISQNDKSKLSGAKVTIYKNGSRVDQVITDTKGKFALSLQPDAKYLLEFSYDGYVSKRVSFSTRNVPPEHASGGNFQFRFDMTLFKEMPGLDVSILNKPLAEISYDPTLVDFNYDKEYTKTVKAQIEKLQEDLEAQMAAEAAAAKEKEANYQKAMAEGDKAAAKADYEAAKRSFAEALAIKPDDNSAKNKLDDATKKYDKLRAEKQTEKQYKDAIEKAEFALYEKNYKVAETEFQNALNAKPGDIYARDEVKKIKDMMVNAAKAEQTYIVAIGKADAALAAKDYLTAKAEYTKAAEAKPEETYPKEQLKQVDGLLTADAKKQTEYIQAIERGESSLENKDYEAAKAAFEQASQVKPEEKYPKDQLTKIKALLAEIELKNKNYTDAVKRGDDAFKTNDFATAKKAYQDALGMRPDEQYPKDQIAAITTKEEEMKQSEARYAELIAGADKRYETKDFIAAKAEYVKALEIKPNEAHPKKRIDEIAGLLEKEAKIEEEYKSAISNADNAFKAKDYTSAKFEYAAASKLKSNEAYPKDQLVKVEAALAEIAKKDEQYTAAIKQADELFSKNDFEGAKAQYTTASGMKPEEEYPKNQLKIIGDKLIELENINKQYEQAIAAADKQFGEGKLEDAKVSYQKALELKLTEAYPKDKIAAITAQLAQAKEADEKYKTLIAQGDEAMGKKDFENAKKAYQDASAAKPNETYPKDKLAEITKLQTEQAAKEKQYQDLITKADASFNSNQLEAALPLYKEAAGVKEGESYPINQITLIEGKMGEMKKKEEDYKAAIATADAAEKTGDLQKALAEFKNASTIKPQEVYPKDKITAITVLIADKEKSEAAYNETITLADEAKKNKEYDIALTAYKKASDLKPNEAYPKNQIKEVEILKTEALAAIELANKQEASYQALIKEGDDLFTQKNYEGSKGKFKAALDIKPTEQYPKTKIAEIEGLMSGLAEQKARDEKYNGLIAAADKAFQAKDWEKAKASYNEAQAVKPAETYPATQLKAIDEAIAAALALASKQEQEAAAKAKEEKYNGLIAAADKSFQSKEWEKAKATYKEAQGVKPEETYPAAQLKAIDEAIAAALALAGKQEQEAAAKAKEEKYNGLIAAADKSFQAKDWENARASYTEAQGVKPEEMYPASQLKAIDAAIAADKALASKQEQEAAAKAKDEQYKGLIVTADKAFESKSWDAARDAYKQAQTVKPAEIYPADQLKAIDAAVAAENALASKKEQEAAAKARDEKYKAAVVAGDKAFQSKDWEKARTSYTEAQGVKPEETYPADQIKAIDEAIAAEKALAGKQEQEAAAKAKEEQYMSAIATGDKAFKAKEWASAKSAYEQALTVKPAEAYPAQRIEMINVEIEKENLAKNANAKKNEYDGHIAAADNAFKAKSWEEAKTGYKAALKVFPEEKYPADQLVKVEEAIAKAGDIALKNKLDEQYRQVIGDADQLFNVSNWQASKSKYQEAAQLKPAETYPKERISEIDAKLAALEKDAAGKEKMYASLIAQADEAFNKKTYAAAKTSYQKALDIKNAEVYPKQRIEEIDKILADLEAGKLSKKENMQKREQYNSLIVKADRSLNNKQYLDAKKNYTLASETLPDETYPKNKLEELEALMNKPVAAATPAPVQKKKSSGMSDAEIAAMMAKWQQERDQAKTDRLNQYQKDLEDTHNERNTAADDRRAEANEDLVQLAVTLSESNKAGDQRNLDEAKLVEEIRADHEKFLEDHAKDSETRRNAVNEDIVKSQEGQIKLAEKGNELYVINTEKVLTHKIELGQQDREREKGGHDKIMANRQELDNLEKNISQDVENHNKDYMKEVERVRNENAQVSATVENWQDESRERRGEAHDNIVALEASISDFQINNRESYKYNTEQYNAAMKQQSEYVMQKTKESEQRRSAAYGDIVDYTKQVSKNYDENLNRYKQNNEAIAKEHTAINDYQAQVSANADERRMKFDRNYYMGEDKPRLPEEAKKYPQGVTEESYEENDAFVVKRIVVTGENIDEYSKIYYKWGGIFYKKNGENTSEVIWNTETE